MRLLLSFIIFCLSVTSALAGTGSPFSLSATFRLFWGLLIVLGVLLVVYALVKRKLPFLNGSGSKGAITIIEMRHLMPRKSLCLVKVRGREYLLGLGNDQINLIAAIDSSLPPATLPADDRNFAAALAAAAADTDESTH